MYIYLYIKYYKLNVFKQTSIKNILAHNVIAIAITIIILITNISHFINFVFKSK